MNKTEVLELIRQALAEVLPEEAENITEETHLVKDGILDSLDSMNFLFELEQRVGKKLEEIDEDFSDFRVSRLVEIVMQETA